MDIGEPIRSFGKVEMAALGAAILAQDEAAWNENVQETNQPQFIRDGRCLKKACRS